MNKTTWFKQKSDTESDFIALKNFVHQLGVKVNDATIKTTLADHPNNGTVLALCDALTEWRIDNVGVRLEAEDLPNVKIPSLTMMKNRSFVVLGEVNDGQVHYLDMNQGWQSEKLEDFVQKWIGITILATVNVNSGEKDYELNRKQAFIDGLRWPFMLVALLILVMVSIATGFNIYNDTLSTWLPLLLVKTLGIGVGALLIIEHLDKHNPVVMKLCGFSTITSCQEVTESPAGTLFGWLSMAEVGLFYFIGSTLTLTFALTSSSGDLLTVLLFLALLNITTLPYSLFSIAYQAIVVKKYCPLCVSAMVLFWMEFIIFISMLNFSLPTISMTAVSMILWGFLLPILVWLGFRPSLMNSRKLPALQKTLNIFKGNPQIFNALLSNEKAVDTTPLAGDLVLGDPKSPINIIMISSPYCRYCTPAFNALEKLINEFPEGVRVMVRVLDGGKRDISRRLVSFSDNTELAAQALHAWYVQKNKDPDNWMQQFVDVETVDEATVEKRLDEINAWCKANEITGTPMFFVNGRKFPLILQITDVKYYLRTLFENAS